MMKKIITYFGFVLALVVLPAYGASNVLDRFFNNVSTFRAEFTQVVLDEALNIIQESSGTLYIKRPNKFRWDYKQPFKQHIVGDGKNIWVYDVELQQITVRKMDGVLGNTPAVLLAGGGKLHKNFIVKSLGKQGKLVWMQLVPRDKDGGYESIRVGFDRGKLRTLEMVDSFGNTTRINLKNNRENIRIKKSIFQFTPPKGVDVVRH